MSPGATPSAPHPGRALAEQVAGAVVSGVTAAAVGALVGKVPRPRRGGGLAPVGEPRPPAPESGS